MRHNRRKRYRTTGACRRLFSRCSRMAFILIFSWSVWQFGVLAGKLSERISGLGSEQVPGQLSESVSAHLHQWQQSFKTLLESVGLFSDSRQGGDGDSSYPWERGWQQEAEEGWETLLLAEQAGAGIAAEAGAEAFYEEQTSSQEIPEGSGDTGESGQERDADVQAAENNYNPFPEDLEGEEGYGIGWLEQDADLQAEIQEEYFLAEQQAALAQNTETAGEQADMSAERQESPEGQMEALTESQGQAGEWSLVYTMDQLRDLDFLRTYIYNVNSSTVVDTELLNADAMLEADMSLAGDPSEGPKILIHHTHATEYFADSDPEDESTLIVGVGDYLAEILETQYGIQVIHDRTVYPYNEAYSQALTHEEELLAAYPTIEVMIDLHRDSAGAGKYTAEIDGKSMANLMFFNGLSRNVNGEIEYLPNPNLADNLAFSFQLKMVADSMYPGLCKRNYLKSYRYNLHILPKAVIVEVGDNNNTVEEAKNAMEPLAKILYTVLMGEQE